MDRLQELESRSIYIIREAYSTIRPLGMLWSIGKDSTVLLWLAKKAFLGEVPFPLIHVDTGFKIPEMIAYRDRTALDMGLQLLVSQNSAALEQKRTFPDGNLNRIECCKTLKTEPLRAVIEGRAPLQRLNLSTGRFESEPGQRFLGLILGIRGDEEGTRSKERYFSLRSSTNSWAILDQPAELWQFFNTEVPADAHLRVHPLLDWTELDVWQYIEREKIGTVPLYYDQGQGERYRSLGCAHCTLPIRSEAKTPLEIVGELRDGALAHVPERAGRAQDKDDFGSLERLRRDGYM